MLTHSPLLAALALAVTGAVGTGTGTQATPALAPTNPLPPNCVETFFAFNGGGAVGGAVYFDLTAVNPTLIGSLLVNYQSPSSGNPVGLEIYTAPVSHVGIETDPSQWTLAAVGDGTAIASAPNEPTAITLAAPLALPAGTTGIALVAVGTSHAYANGSGTNQVHTSADGNLTLTAGSASNTPFLGATFVPRVWNGRLCPVLGDSYCAAAANSTGSVGKLTASGSTFVTANSVLLRASQLPAQQFGIFAVSTAQELNVGAGGTSNGNLCLGGTIGRLGGGMVLSSGATGSFSLALDLTAVPLGGQVVGAAPGDTLNFQAWHRDTVGLGSNFTEALSVTFD